MSHNAILRPLEENTVRHGLRSSTNLIKGDLNVLPMSSHQHPEAAPHHPLLMDSCATVLRLVAPPSFMVQ